MADIVQNTKTSLTGEDVIVRSVQFFTNERWQPVSQSARVATFKGKASIPWFLLFLTVMGFFFFVLPGIIIYFVVIRRMYRFQNLVITCHPLTGGTEVSVSFPKHASKLVSKFFAALPSLA